MKESGASHLFPFLETPFCCYLFLVTMVVFCLDIWSIFYSAPHCDEDLFMNVSWRLAKTSDWLSAIQSKENFIGGTNYPLFDAVMAIGINILGDSRINLRFFALLLALGGLTFGLFGLQRIRFFSHSQGRAAGLAGEYLIKGTHQKVAFICLSLLSYSFFFASHCLRPECVAIFILGLLFWLFTLVHIPIIRFIAVLICSFAVPWSGLHFVVPAGAFIFLAWLFFRFSFHLVAVSAIGMSMGVAAFFSVFATFGLLDLYRFQMVAYGVTFQPIHNFVLFLCGFPQNLSRFAAALLPLPLAVSGMFLFSSISSNNPLSLSGKQRAVVCVSLYSVITFLCMNALRGTTGGGMDRFVLHIPLVAVIACWFPETFWKRQSKRVLKSLWIGLVFFCVSLRLITLYPGVMSQSNVREQVYVEWSKKLTKNDDVLLTSRSIGLFGSVRETFFSTDLLGSIQWRQFQSVAPLLNSPLEYRITLAILDNGVMGATTAKYLSEKTSSQWVEVGEPLIGSCVPVWSKPSDQLVYRAYRRDMAVSY